MRVALVHDHLVQHGGAENVLLILQAMFPKAPTFTLVYDKKRMGPAFEKKKIKTSFIQQFPFGVSHYRWYISYMPAATEGYDLTEYDVVISSCSAFAKGIITRPETIHICYCHTPTRYLWSDTHSYVRELKSLGIVKKVLPLTLSKLRQWDRQAADRVDYFIANSQAVADRIKKYYQRDSLVIYPPVNTKEFSYDATAKQDYYLIGGRVVPYKRFDIAVSAFNQLNMPLVVFGDGPDLKRIKQMARGPIKFVGAVSDAVKKRLYQNCKAFIYPQEEDFGITAIEAMASGKPVIAYKAGGAKETVIDNKTGIFFEDQGWESLANAIINFEQMKFDGQEIMNHARKFDTQVFQDQIHTVLSDVYKRV